MSTVFTAKDIINRAAALIGSQPVDDVQDDTIGGQSYEMLYDSRLRMMLELHTWSFATLTVVLGQVADVTPLSGFEKVYMVPANALGDPLRITDSLNPNYDFWEYLIEDRYVHSNASLLYGTVRIVPEPSRWSGSFSYALIVALAGDLAMALTSDERQKQVLHSDAFGTPSEGMRGGLVRVAINANDYAKPPKRMTYGGDPLSQARYF